MNSSTACSCRLHEPVDPGTTWDDGDRQLVGNVLEYGWHALMIAGAEAGPEWLYTVGLRHNYGVPDLVMSGLPFDGMHHWVGEAVAMIENGRQFDHDEPVTGIIEEHTVFIRDVDPSWTPALFGYGTWFARNLQPPMQQIIWPDMHGKPPWDEEASNGCRNAQGRLWLHPLDHPNNAWTQYFSENQ